MIHIYIYIIISPIGDAPPQVGRLIDRRSANRSATTRRRRRPPGKTSTAWVRPLPAVCGANCKCTHSSMNAAAHIDTGEYIVPARVDYHELQHRSPPGPQASTSHPPSPIHSALVGGGQPVCDLLHVAHTHKTPIRCTYRRRMHASNHPVVYWWMAVHRIWCLTHMYTDIYIYIHACVYIYI